MNRDGLRKSVWQEEGAAFSTSFPDAGEVYDVVIAGAGITGVSCALRLQSMGQKCVLLEAANMGFGTTGGTTAHLNNFFDASYDQVIKDFGEENARLLAKAGRDAIDLIRKNIADGNISCDFAERTGYLFALDDKQAEQLDSIVEASNQVGISMQYVNENPFPIPFTKIAAIPHQAQFHPVKYIKGVAEDFIARGGIYCERCRVVEASEEDDVVNVVTDKGTLKARHLIYATHIPPGINLLHFTNAPYRSYALAVTLKDNVYPQALGYDLNDSYHYYRTQHINGKEYLIAGGEDHKTGHENDTDACFSRLEAYVRGHFDVLSIDYSWSSQYFIPADGLPYIGAMPGANHIYTGTGYNGNGMIFGTVASMVLSDLIVRGDSEYKKLFSPTRIKPVASFTNTVKENADVIMHFVKDKLLAEKINSLAEIGENQAKVVRYNGHSYAIYKDEQGQAHIVNSSCTHAQCNVQWNNAEKSWDCPCHGSRFGIDGVVLTAPAVKGLDNLQE